MIEHFCKSAISNLTLGSLVLISFSPSALASAKVGKLFEVKNTTGVAATDIDLTIRFPENFENLEAGCDPFNQLTSTSGAGREFDLIFESSMNPPQTVPDGGTAVCEIKLKSRENGLRVLDTSWTGLPGELQAEADSVIIGDFPLNGFLAEDSSSNTKYTIFNDLDFGFEVRNLQFLVDVPEISSANLLSGNTPAFSPVFPDFTLSPGEFREFDFPAILGNNFLYVKSELFNPGDGSLVITFDEHQGVPEPSSALGSLGLFIVGAAFALNRKFKLKNKEKCK